MDVGWVAPTTINSCVCILSSLLFNLYAIVYILLIIYLYIIVSYIHLFKFAKRDHHPIHPLSRVITIGWISLIFLTHGMLKLRFDHEDYLPNRHKKIHEKRKAACDIDVRHEK